MPRFVLALLLVALFGGNPSSASEEDPGEALFELHCATCHPTARALKKNKERAGWEKTVARMQGYASGMITDDDATAIVEYLIRVRGPEE